MQPRSRFLGFLPNLFIALCGVLMVFGYKSSDATLEDLPRKEKLPLFDPHIPAYTCAPVALPPFDAQADAWFREARALEDPEIYIDDRDYKKIVTLTRQAAERKHWKAMINLASFIIEGRDPSHGVEDAVQLVEAAMKMGVPAAYDRMGTYYMNGTGVKADATRAYAFWQRAALMGNPDALTFLGKKLQFREDQINESGWANAAVGVKMLECAYSQGDGNAAYELGLVHSIPADRAATKTDLVLALNALHEGVKLGSRGCAGKLWIEFDRPMNPLKKIAPFIDHARSERYKILSSALEFDPARRFPNLDRILPLPPAALPAWNGDIDTLVNAARGVGYPAPQPPLSTAHSGRMGRFFVDPVYRLVPTDDVTEDATAPFTGYWQPVYDDDQSHENRATKIPEPALYQVGERFERIDIRHKGKVADGAPGLRWRHWRTVKHDQGTISPPVVSGHTSLVDPPTTATACAPRRVVRLLASGNPGQAQIIPRCQRHLVSMKR